MCKKVFIATLAVLAAVAVVGGTKLASHLRCWKQQAWRSIESRIPPEQEIARLRMELRDLERQDGRFFEQVAREGVQVEKLEARVSALRKKMATEETRIRARRASLTGEGEFVTYNGERFPRSSFQAELRMAASRFRTDEATLQSREEELAAKKQRYELNHRKLHELKLQRQKMATELQVLETALAKERQAQAEENSTLDDAAYRRLREEMDRIGTRIKVMTRERELRKEVSSPVRAAEERKEQDAKDDQYLNDRFGGKSDKQ
jgi:hypothetical protein